MLASQADDAPRGACRGRRTATSARGGREPIRLKGEEDVRQVRETRMRPMMTRRPVAAMTAINFF